MTGANTRAFFWGLLPRFGRWSRPLLWRFHRLVAQACQYWRLNGAGATVRAGLRRAASTILTRLRPEDVTRVWPAARRSAVAADLERRRGCADTVGESEPCLTPVILPGGGRNGSTALMSLLGTSPQIAFDRVGEFEHRYLTYFLRWAQLVDRSRNDSAWNDDVLMTPQDDVIGPLCWKEADLIRTQREAFGQRCFLAMWREFSRVAAANTSRLLDSGSLPVRYYAEKSCPWVARELTGVMPFRAIHLLRDPRDVWLSVQAYDGKRGFYGFGRRPTESDADFLDRFIQSQRTHLDGISKVTESDVVAVVRYEHLVDDLAGEARRLGDWLGVSLDADAAVAQAKRFRYHMTSRSPQASVQRWKRELDPSLKSVFTRHLGPLLERLGYES